MILLPCLISLTEWKPLPVWIIGPIHLMQKDIRMNGRKSLLGLGILFAASICWSGPTQEHAVPRLHAGRNNVEFTFQDRHRTAVVFIPEKIQIPANGWPLVMMLHGAGGSSKNVIKSTGWSELGEHEGFVSVFPNGTPRDENHPESFLSNPQTWNSGAKGNLSSGKESATDKNVDDVGFLDELLSRVRSAIKINPQRINVAGHSNGASMAYRFGMEHSDVVAAVGVVAGHFLIETRLLRDPVSLIQIVGDHDPFTPMAGGEAGILNRKVIVTPALESPRRWAVLLGLSPNANTIQDDSKLTVSVWGPGKNGEEVKSIVIKGHGHSYPSPTDRFHPRLLFGPTVHTLNATEVMWKFFEDHPKK